MKKIGLALSGGGFRATLCHLGLLRFFRDAGLLSQVTHITSVSGGSIMAAHLVLHWERYTGCEADFEAAAAELLSFVQLDIRNRILRRFPLAVPVGWLLRLCGKSNRKLTRAGLLEYHYERYLFGDVSLFELPKAPKLHILTTNLSEGCLCSFHRDGLLMARRQNDGRFRLEEIHTGLATVAMAVAASSAFPGFFPPLELTGAEVGVSGGEYGKQAYTDGGVYDNLGIRMFRFLDRQILLDERLTRQDFIDLKSAFEALRSASVSSEETALRRVAEVLEEAGRSAEETPLHRLAVVLEQLMQDFASFDSAVHTEPGVGSPPFHNRDNGVEQVLARLWEVMCHYQFQHEPVFADLKPEDPSAAEFLKANRVGTHTIEVGDQFWLNLHLLEAAFRQATGHGCFKRLNSGLDCVIVSDVGRQIKIVKDPGGGLVRSALRSSDILMNRVWQLENETFRSSNEFIFSRVGDVIEPEEDPGALHPEIQRQLSSIRTDLDRFSPLEISSLVRHGYCLARNLCRSRPDVFGSKLPAGPPWDPYSSQKSADGASAEDGASPSLTRLASSVTAEARELQTSSIRRIWSNMLDRRDWVSYIYVPILVPIMLFLPYISVHYYKRFVRLNNLTLSYAQGSPDLAQLRKMLDDPPLKAWKGVTVEEGHEGAPPDLSRFKVLSDSRITDLRNWNPATVGGANPDSRVYVHRRLSVIKLPDREGASQLAVRLILAGPEGEVRFPPGQPLQGKVVKTLLADGKSYRWDAVFDFTRAPTGTPVDVLIEIQAPGMFLRGSETATGMEFPIDAETAEFSQWVLMPEGRSYSNFRYIYFKQGQPETATNRNFVTRYLAEDHSVLAFKLLSLEPGYQHEISWDYELE